MKKLVLTFVTAAGTTLSMTVPNPKEELDLKTVKTAAASITPILVNRAGLPAVGLKKAVIVTESEEVLS